MQDEKDELFFLMAEVGRKVVASSEIHILGGDEKHDDDIGIVISFRGLGIETEMMKTLAEQATA